MMVKFISRPRSFSNSEINFKKAVRLMSPTIKRSVGASWQLVKKPVTKSSFIEKDFSKFKIKFWLESS